MAEPQTTTPSDEVRPSLSPMETIKRQPPLQFRCGEGSELGIEGGCVWCARLSVPNLDIVQVRKEGEEIRQLLGGTTRREQRERSQRWREVYEIALDVWSEAVELRPMKHQGLDVRESGKVAPVATAKRPRCEPFTSAPLYHSYLFYEGHQT